MSRRSFSEDFLAQLHLINMAAMPSASSFAATGQGEYLMDLLSILCELEDA